MSKTTMTLGAGLELPLSTVTQKLAFLASSGVGKTYAATKLAEEMYRAGQQFVALDPVGVWYGLRLQADGRTPSDIDIPVFGGLHGDLPLEREHGRLLAQLVATKGLRCVLDVSLMRKGDRIHFATEFLEELFFLKKTHRSALHLFFEEAQFFAPEERGPSDIRLTGAVQDVCCVGRNYGIGYTLISLAPQLIQKRVLNLVQILFCLQISGKHERKAIAEWASVNGLDSESVDMNMIQTLHTGEAFLWSPRVLKRMDKVTIGLKTTFDASATPDGATDAVKLGSIDLDALGDEMKALAEEVKASTPDALKARIKELEEALAEKEECAHEGKPTGLVHKQMYDQLERTIESLTEERDALDRTVTRKNGVIQELRTRLAHAVETSDVIAKAVESIRSIAASAPPEEAEETEPVSVREIIESDSMKDPRHGSMAAKFDGVLDERGVGPDIEVPARAPTRHTEPTSGKSTEYPLGARRMLEAIVTHPHGLTPAQLRMLAELKQSGTFDKYKSMLRTAELITMDGSLFKPTAKGERAARRMGIDLTKHRTVKELLDAWRATIDGSGKQMFDVIVNAGRRGVTRVDIALKAKITQSGTFDKYLSQIRSTGCFEFSKGKEALIKVRQDLHTLCEPTQA